ncbi:MAG: hypothetical protein J6Y89_10145 [Lachnospiraceae bacterium]|nr:hypothetical protein [Lachnospiraceae bacterium]
MSEGYKNFTTAVYCTVGDVNSIGNFDDFDREFEHICGPVHVDKVYLEYWRGNQWCSKEHMLEVKAYFEKKGIKTSGGITTCASGGEGFESLCYSDEEDKANLKKAVELCASTFDEFIFDEFYFTNCRCEKCLEAKGNRSWADFRMAQKLEVTKDIVIRTAKEINPKVNAIIKYPQWFEYYNETGYDLVEEPKVFDSIYTGTETRNPDYSQQHLPKYLGYFVMRYLESAAPGRNLGGWFDPFDCSYNLTSYLEQAYMTLFAKAKEVTLFCLGALRRMTPWRLMAPSIGEMFRECDEYLDKLGKPVGAAAYRPGRARGESDLHSYLGMCGIPMEPCFEYPADAKTVFLTEGASADPDIFEKMHDTMLKGGECIVTSGFVKKNAEAFRQFVNITVTDRKAVIREYAGTHNNGINLDGRVPGFEEVMIPQIEYCTNDVWELAAGYAKANNFPIVLRTKYGKGHISIITIPDNMGDLYNYPADVLNVIRGLFTNELPVKLLSGSGVAFFAYDNGTYILRSDLPYSEGITLEFAPEIKAVKDARSGRELKMNEAHQIRFPLMPGINTVLITEKE